MGLRNLIPLVLPLLVADAPLGVAAQGASYHNNAGVLQYVNPLIGTEGPDPNSNGGMIPSVAPPFAKTRWTPQTRENFISQVAYSNYDSRVHGFQATHQPAIWMGEFGQLILMPGMGDVQTIFQHRGLTFRKEDEKSTPYVYEVLLDADSVADFGYNLTEQWAVDQGGVCQGGEAYAPDTVVEGADGRTRKRDLVLETEEREYVSDPKSTVKQLFSRNYQRSIRAAMTASAHVGHLRFDFMGSSNNSEADDPFIVIQASRLNWTGSAEISNNREVVGTDTTRQDYALGPWAPPNFKSYWVTRFSAPFKTYGITQGGNPMDGVVKAEGKEMGAYVTFDKSVERVEVRTGISFVSIDQARHNLDLASPDHATFEDTVESTKAAWLEKLGRFTVTGANQTVPENDPKTNFYTALFHSLQYPNDFSEPSDNTEGGLRKFYSGYMDTVYEAADSYYQSWSLWDTYRAQHSFLTLLAPERVNSMMRSLLRIFDWTGRLPIWNNVIETNIMIATHADSVLANALARGFQGFNVTKAWEAVKEDAYTPPDQDEELLYFDREGYTPHEARAGLTKYLKKGYVPNDGWSESASRTLGYAFNDYACAVVATYADEIEAAKELFNRSGNYANIWNNDDEFMRARNDDGSWANETWGWTEGDQWVYTFDVMHDVGGLADLFKNGKDGMKSRMDEYFSDGHNFHSNEPSHHVPYLYSILGHPESTAEQVRKIAWSEYNATAGGLSGNEDLGQMSAWYIFSAMGFYPVNPAGEEYIIGSPFFDKLEIKLPEGPNVMSDTLTILAPGASAGKIYVQGLKLDGESVDQPVLTHMQIIGATTIEFQLGDEPGNWGKNGTLRSV